MSEIKKYGNQDWENTILDNSKARELLGWKPTQNFEEWVTKWKKDLGL